MRTFLKIFLVSVFFNGFIIQPAISFAYGSGGNWNNNNNGWQSNNNNNNSNWHGNSPQGNWHPSGGNPQWNNNWHGNYGNYGWGNHSYVGANFYAWSGYNGPYYPPTDAVLVSPPVYDPVQVNGATYYVNDGTYYSFDGFDYHPVAPPVEVTEQAPVTVVQPPVTVVPPQSDSADAYTVNIPNNKGGYNPVTLKKSGTGFIGPQGEFYAQFPTVAQLKVMYGN